MEIRGVWTVMRGTSILEEYQEEHVFFFLVLFPELDLFGATVMGRALAFYIKD